MVMFKKEGISKSKIVISEIYSDVYLKIIKHQTLPLVLHLFTYLATRLSIIYTTRTSYATLRDAINALFALRFSLHDVRNYM